MTKDHPNSAPGMDKNRWYDIKNAGLTRPIILTLCTTLILSTIYLMPWEKPSVFGYQGSINLWYAVATLILALTGFIVGFKLKGLLFWLALAGISLSLGAGQIYQWKMGPFLPPWLLYGFYFFCPAILIYLEKKRVFELKTVLLKDSLTKRLDNYLVDEILDNSHTLSLEPKNQITTVMFVNFTEFYLAAEKQPPHDAFRSLKEILTEIKQIVHLHGGIITTTNGDGLSCVFGYNCDGSEAEQDHAHQATLCAVEIQRSNLDRNIEAAEARQPIYPLRIGINTAPIYIGDLSDSHHIDLIMVGQGVSQAKALENACDQYCIMIGALTKDMLLEYDDSDFKLTKRHFQAKRFNVYFEAYECDPAPDDDKRKSIAIGAHRNFLGRRRMSQRWSLPPGISISVVSSSADKGRGKLLNFAIDGFGVLFDHYLAVGTSLNMVLDNENGNLKNSLESLGILPIVAEVRWGRPHDSGQYLLGLQIQNLSKQQREALLVLMRTCISHEMPQVVNQ